MQSPALVQINELTSSSSGVTRARFSCVLRVLLQLHRQRSVDFKSGLCPKHWTLDNCLQKWKAPLLAEALMTECSLQILFEQTTYQWPYS